MAHRDYLPDLPPEHLTYLRAVLEREGLHRAISILGIGRTALLGALALGRSSAGTAALIREAYSRKDVAA